MDQSYVKAYHRRGLARMGLKQYKEAKQDFDKVVKLDSANKEGKAMLQKVTRILESLKVWFCHEY